jgi:hypothetical protein
MNTVEAMPIALKAFRKSRKEEESELKVVIWMRFRVVV